jgi:hypothetical protein
MATSDARPVPSPAVKGKTPWWLLVGSSLAFALAFFAMTLVHEFAHGVAAVLLGYAATVHATSADSTPIGVADAVMIAMAGPVFSLALGLVLLLTVRLRPGLGGRGVGRLFLVWFVLQNLYEFVGYLMTAPFLAIGDIHQTVELLGWPVWVDWLVAVVGLVGWVGLGRVATLLLLEAAGPERADVLVRLRMLGIFSWFAGVVLVLLGTLALGALAEYSVWAAAGAGSYVSLVVVLLRRVHPRAASHVHVTPAGAAVTVMMLVLLVAAERVWFLPGVHLGG